MLDDEGRELDATLDIEPRSYGADVVLHARGGRRESSTNPDYFPALELVLERMSRAVPTIEQITVDSKVALQMSAERRVVEVGCPIVLTPATDMKALRIRITEAQPAAASSMAAGRLGGNKTKRIRIRFSFDTEASSAAELLDARADAVATNDPASSVFGRPYTDDPVNRSVTPAGVFSRDDSKLERALAGHAVTQNGLAAHLREHGLEPRKRGFGEPDFDIAWVTSKTVVVAEVKTLHKSNLVHQLRVGIGQVLQYRELLRARQACR
ncbi:MAG: hypothetical protein R2705_13470 [Ilumatobacteraceae bacterium]